METEKRVSMHLSSIDYGIATIEIMDGDEPGYAGRMLISIKLSAEALEMATKSGARVLQDGSIEPLNNEPGVICFGRYKGDRPRLD